MPDFVATWGDPASPTVLLLPGAGGTQWLWTPHATTLEDSHRVVSIDMPAHGVHPEATFSFDRALEDLDRVLEAEGPAVLVGHSLGGHVAAEAAAAHSARVEGLLLAGVAPTSGVLEPYRDRVLSYVLEAAAHSTRIREWLDEQYGLEDDRQVPPEDLETHDEAIAMARGMRAALSRDSLAGLRSYDGPIMLAAGEEQDDAEAAADLAERIGARFRRYEGGHGVPSRQPERFVPIVERFLGRVYDE